jgi:fibro-slime domain-containing protein
MTIINNNTRWKYKGFYFGSESGYVSNPIGFNEKIYFMTEITFSTFNYIAIYEVNNLNTTLDENMVLSTDNFPEIGYPFIYGNNEDMSHQMIVFNEKLYALIGGNDNENDTSQLYLFESSDGTNWTYIVLSPPWVEEGEYREIYPLDMVIQNDKLYIAGGEAFIIFDGTTVNYISQSTPFDLPLKPDDILPSGDVRYDYYAIFNSVNILNDKIICAYNFKYLSWSSKTRSQYDIDNNIFWQDQDRQFLLRYDPETGEFSKYTDWKEFPCGEGLTNLISFNNKLYFTETVTAYVCYPEKIWQVTESTRLEQPGAIILECIIRDFKINHPDFEYNISGLETGIVQNILGEDKKPIWNPSHTPRSVTTEENFNQWFNDTEGINQKINYNLELLLDEEDGKYKYLNNLFFPIDGRLWGNEGNTHNYHFTLELHTQFVYKSEDIFYFRGDDDLWVFINNQLVIDLGGVHSTSSASINLDTLGLIVGEIYDMDIFFTERHTVSSVFEIQTTIDLISTITGIPELVMDDFAWPNEYYPKLGRHYEVKLGTVDNKLMFSASRSEYDINYIPRISPWDQSNYRTDTILIEESDVSGYTNKYSTIFTVSQPWTNSNMIFAFINEYNNIIHSMIHTSYWFGCVPLEYNDNIYILTTGNILKLFYTEPTSCEWAPTNLNFINSTLTAIYDFNNYIYLSGVSSSSNDIIYKFESFNNITNINLSNNNIQTNDITRKSCFCVYRDNLYFASGKLVYKLIGTTWIIILNLSEDAPNENWENYLITSMEVYDDILYIGGMSIIKYNGTNFNFEEKIIDFINETEQGITALCAYDEYLYIGVLDSTALQGFLYEYDGNDWIMKTDSVQYRSTNILDDNKVKSAPFMAPIVDMKVYPLNNNDVLYILESFYFNDTTRQNSRLLYCDSVHVFELGAFPRDVLTKISRYGDDIILIGSSGSYECIWYCDTENYIYSNVYTGRSGYINSIFGYYQDEFLDIYPFTFSNLNNMISPAKFNMCGVIPSPPIALPHRVYPVPLENSIEVQIERKYPIVH